MDPLDVYFSSLVQRSLDCIGDLQFAPPGGLNLLDSVKDPVVEDVYAGECPVAEGFLGLLDITVDVALRWCFGSEA